MPSVRKEFDEASPRNTTRPVELSMVTVGASSTSESGRLWLDGSELVCAGATHVTIPVWLSSTSVVTLSMSTLVAAFSLSRSMRNTRVWPTATSKTADSQLAKSLRSTFNLYPSPGGRAGTSNAPSSVVVATRRTPDALLDTVTVASGSPESDFPSKTKPDTAPAPAKAWAHAPQTDVTVSNHTQIAAFICASD